MNQRGLTLIELLIALTIFAFVSAAALAALNLGVSGSTQLQDATDRISELERMRTIVRNDLAMAVDVPVYESEATLRRPSFVAGEIVDDVMPEPDDGEWLFALVRGGWTNIDAMQPRAEIQPVGYLAIDDALVRRTRPFLDATRETPHRDQVLLDDLQDLEVQFYQGGDWDEDIEPETLPTAIRLSFVHPAYGQMHHDFLMWEIE
ncbi:MAG: type II secretion system minor pseudopilin GspJ [Pseudomonadota bacterium]